MSVFRGHLGLGEADYRMDKAILLEYLAEVEADIARCAKLVEKRSHIILNLVRAGYAVPEAADFLNQLEESQPARIAERDRIRDELAETLVEVAG
jgi:hypothetical protein